MSIPRQLPTISIVLNDWKINIHIASINWISMCVCVLATITDKHVACGGVIFCGSPPSICFSKNVYKHNTNKILMRGIKCSFQHMFVFHEFGKDLSSMEQKEICVFPVCFIRQVSFKNFQLELAVGFLPELHWTWWEKVCQLVFQTERLFACYLKFRMVPSIFSSFFFASSVFFLLFPLYLLCSYVFTSLCQI